MVALPDFLCPTLEQADAALADRQERRLRPYLGISAIGNACERALWYAFRWAALADFDSATLKRFADGHASEAVAVDRLRRTPGLEVHDLDDTGEQFGFKDMGGHFSGHMDGVILGLVQAPKTWHVLEIKSSEKWADLDKARKKVGEKNALAEWNPIYYAQAVLYMDYAGLDRHYLVCVSPGARRWTAVRTNADPVYAQILKDKARRIIFSDHAPKRIGGPTNFGCQSCDMLKVCHEGAQPRRTCRSCIHAEVFEEGGWGCALLEDGLDRAAQERGCPHHRYLPDLVPGDQIDASPAGITYRMGDGSTWIDRGQEP